MSMNKNELKNISMDFRSIATRLINATESDGPYVLEKFVTYIEKTPLIYEYITSLEVKTLTVEEILKGDETHGFRYNFGISDEEEIANTYKFLRHLVESKAELWVIGFNLNVSSATQSTYMRTFGERVVNPFVMNIERYLKKIMINMGCDEEQKYSIIVEKGNPQVNIVSGSGSIAAIQKNMVEIDKLEELIISAKNSLSEILDDTLRGNILDSLETIQEEMILEGTMTRSVKLAKSVLQSAVEKIPSALSVTANIASIIALLSQHI